MSTAVFCSLVVCAANDIHQREFTFFINKVHNITTMIHLSVKLRMSHMGLNLGLRTD